MHRIPTSVKVVYSAFVAVLVPYYWVTYTPWNFMYFCDVALLVTLVGMWTESALLISTQAVGILLPQTLWVFDFVSRATLGVHITGMTEYMFNPNLPLFVRALSSFHGWLPFVLIWLLMRLGYDRRAFRVQVPFVILLLLACYSFAPVVPPAAHPGYAANINYVHGMDDRHPQTTMAPALWLLLMMAVNVIGFHTPTHFTLARVFRRQAPGADRCGDMAERISPNSR